MTILTQTTNYSEANSGDTTNPGANFGDVSQGNWPLLGFDSSGKAVFSGTFSSSSDSDFFAIDVAGGTHDWSGSLGASAGFTVTVTLTGGGGTFTIQGRREDYTYLGNFGPYGSNTVVYNSSTDPSTVTVSNAAWTSSWGSGGSTTDYVLGFQLVGSGYTGGYTITIQADSSGGGGGGGGGGSPPNLSARINSLSASSVAAGSQLTINTSIINSGDGDAGSEQVGYYLATDSNFTNNVRFLGYVTLPGVASHVETVFPNIIFSIPSDVAAGSYYIRAVANYDHQISNETNFNDNA